MYIYVVDRSINPRIFFRMTQVPLYHEKEQLEQAPFIRVTMFCISSPINYLLVLINNNSSVEFGYYIIYLQLIISLLCSINFGDASEITTHDHTSNVL